jgi:putative transposase
LEALYKSEEDPKVKERLLLILRVEGDRIIPAHAAGEMHRSRPWTSYWLERFKKEGVGGLKDKPRSGRPVKLPTEVALRIRSELSESSQGWTTKQVGEMISREGKTSYHYTHIYRLLHKWGFKQKVPRKRHVNAASREEKLAFKKGTRSS